MRSVTLHLVSDSTADTARSMARACISQFDKVDAVHQVWRMTRTEAQVHEILKAVEKTKGFVLFTLVDNKLRDILEQGCRNLAVPCIDILQPVIDPLAVYLGAEVHGRPGRQHAMDAEYFNRIDAINFALTHDDGQSVADLDEADVIILGVSRSTKTPTCIYLANRGIRAANMPILLGSAPPPELFEATNPLIVGLTRDPKRLVQIRRSRMRVLNRNDDTDYVDVETVIKEVRFAQRLCSKYDWPVIDVTRNSVEEIAATILQLINTHRDFRD
jgi:[pyruvate, water dikinase]-phosphate phosphotransferase / [pyruvate, water dikinase] kinase